MAKDSSFFNDSMRLRDPSQQKRKKARTPININGEFILEGHSERSPCTLTDIGTGGLSLVSRTILYQGDKLTLRFKLRGQMLKLHCFVTRVSGKNIGVQFAALKDEDLEIIQSFIHTAVFESDKSKRTK